MTVAAAIDDLELSREFPVSAAQQALLDAAGDPAHASTRLPVRVQILRLRGGLDQPAFARSFAMVSQRQEILRTTLHKVHGAWKQFVHDAVLAPLEITQLSSLETSGLHRTDASHRGLPGQAEDTFSGDTAAAAIQAIGERLATGCATTEAGSLFRAVLVRSGSDEFFLVLAANSLLLDLFSFDILLEELRAIYAVETGAAPGPLAEAGSQYADMALWEASMRGAVPARGSVRIVADARGASDSPEPSRDLVSTRQSLSPHAATSFTNLALALASWSVQPASSPGSAGHKWAGSASGPIAVPILTSGRLLPELERCLGPLQRTVSLAVSPEQSGGETGLPAPANQGPSPAQALAEAKRQAGLVDHGTRSPLLSNITVLLVEEPLTLDHEFAPGIAARWTTLAEPLSALGLRSDGPHRGVTFAIRLLVEESTLSLGAWSRTLSQLELEQAAAQLATLLATFSTATAAPGLGTDAPAATSAERPGPPAAMASLNSVLAAPRNEPLASAPSPANPSAPAVDVPDDVERKLAAIWSAVLQIRSIGRHENFFDLGGHSLLAVRIGTRIERAFGQEIALNAILEKPTIAEFAQLLREASPSSHSPAELAGPAPQTTRSETSPEPKPPQPAAPLVASVAATAVSSTTEAGPLAASPDAEQQEPALVSSAESAGQSLPTPAALSTPPPAAASLPASERPPQPPSATGAEAASSVAVSAAAKLPVEQMEPASPTLRVPPSPAEPRRHRLVAIQEPRPPLTATTPFFWVPGGRAISVLALREVSLLLGPDRPVYGIESRLPQPGEDFLSVPDRARAYVELVRERQPHGPYLLAGFCMGGMVAFEMAQQLRQQGEEVGFLGLLQASMPGFPAGRRLHRRMERQRRLYLAKTALQFLSLRLSPARLKASHEKSQQVFDRFAKMLTGWVSTSSQLPDPTQRDNGQAMRVYSPSFYPGAVHIFLAEDCFESVGIEATLDPRQGWIGVAGPGSVILTVPGDHASMLTQAPARNLAAAIRAIINPVR